MFIDIIAIIAVGLGLYSGYSKGLIRTIFDTLSILIAIVAALKLSPMVINLLEGFLPLNASLVFIIGFIATFFLIMLLIRFVGKKLESLMKVVNINIVNKLLGAGLMALFYSLIVSYAIWGATKLQVVSQETLDSSQTYPMLSALPEQSQTVFDSVKPIFSDFWEKMLETMDGIKEKGESLESDTTG